MAIKTDRPHRLALRVQIEHENAGSICDYLAAETGISKTKIKVAMQKGAVQLKRSGRGRKRIRRATTPLRRGDRLELHYDDAVLATTPPDASCLANLTHYSVWFKPAGLMTQGTRFGDHCSLIRQAERHFKLRRPVFPVHRLDREATGLVLLAHSRSAADKLSQLFRERGIEKHYRATVRGEVGPPTSSGTIDLPLDGKPAVTNYTVVSFDLTGKTTRLEIRTESGRKHQIRRHLASIGHPVMGDPAYGRGNKSATGLQLWATRLAFTCPYRNKLIAFDLIALLPEYGRGLCR